jgi:hypothetical protein
VLCELLKDIHCVYFTDNEQLLGCYRSIFSIFWGILNTSNGDGCARANRTITESAFRAGLATYTAAGEKLALALTHHALIRDGDRLTNVHKTGTNTETACDHGQKDCGQNNDN